MNTVQLHATEKEIKKALFSFSDAEEVAKLLEEAGSQLVHLGKEYHIGFDEEKTEAALFTRK